MTLLANAAFLAFILFWVFLILDFPLFVVIGLSAIAALVLTQAAPLGVVPYTMISALDSFPLLATPLYVLVGILITRSGIAHLLVDSASRWLNRLPGGLPMVTIIVGALLGSVSGSNIANVAALSFLIVGMFNAGYEKPYAVAVVATACTFGVIIPPSINLIIYGVISDTSISKLFAAGFGPGLLLAGVLLCYIFFSNRRKGALVPRVDVPAEAARIDDTRTQKILAGMLAPVIILGGIYAGVFTPTESAAVAVVYLILADLFVFRQMKWKEVPEVLIEMGRTNGVIMMLIATSALFAWLIQTQGAGSALSAAVMDISGGSSYVVLGIINAMLIVLGAFVEPTAVIYMMVPLLKPLLVQVQVDLIHFGAIMTTTLSMAHLTPPVGLSLFFASQIAKVPFVTVCRAVVPFIICELIVILLVTYIPSISLFFASFVG